MHASALVSWPHGVTFSGPVFPFPPRELSEPVRRLGAHRGCQNLLFVPRLGLGAPHVASSQSIMVIPWLEEPLSPA